MSRNVAGGAPSSGVRRPSAGDPTACRVDSRLDARQAVEGREDDDLAAGSAEELDIPGARSTPSSADVRSDDHGVPNGEPP